MKRLLLALVVGGYFGLFSHAAAFPLVAKCDQTQDGVINSADLAAVARAWGTPSGDIDLDGTTNSADLAGCAAAFNRWSYPDDGDGDPAGAIATKAAAQPA